MSADLHDACWHAEPSDGKTLQGYGGRRQRTLGTETRPPCFHIDVTRDIIAALAVMGVTLNDHLIFVETEYVRLKRLEDL